MDPFEPMFRTAFFHDFGTTPERVIDAWSPEKNTCRWLLRQPGPSGYSTSHFELSLQEMLMQFRAHILTEARRFNIDGRAIAGAIIWEYEQNWCPGRASDHAPKWLRFLNDGAGWGSVHRAEAKALRPGITRAELNRIRYEAASAITLVAEIMDHHASRYFRGTVELLAREATACFMAPVGVSIRDTPSVLAFFFNTGSEALGRSVSKAPRRVAARKRDTDPIDLVVTENPMGRWILKHSKRLETYRTVPTRESSRVIHVHAR